MRRQPRAQHTMCTRVEWNGRKGRAGVGRAKRRTVEHVQEGGGLGLAVRVVAHTRVPAAVLLRQTGDQQPAHATKPVIRCSRLSHIYWTVLYILPQPNCQNGLASSPVRSGLIRPGRAGSAAHCPLCVSPVGGSSPIRSSTKRSAPLLNAPLLNAPLRPVSEQPSAPERNRTNAKEVWPLTHDRSVCAALRCAFAQRTPTIESDCPSPILSEFSSPDAACQCQPDLQLI